MVSTCGNKNIKPWKNSGMITNALSKYLWLNLLSNVEICSVCLLPLLFTYSTDDETSAPEGMTSNSVPHY